MGGGYGPFIAHHRTRRKSTRLPFWVLYWVLYWVLFFGCFYWVLFFDIWRCAATRSGGPQGR